MKLIIIGPQGSGKGTHAKKLAALLGILHISTGDLLRELAAQPTKEGAEIKDMLATGALFSDDFMLQILRKRLDKPDAEKGFILDGFPRTLNQANILEQITKIDRAIYLNVPDNECVRRLAGRKTCTHCGSIYGNENPPKKDGKCDNCGSTLRVREDDKEETIRKRLGLYHQQTEPILDLYRRDCKLVEINIQPFRSPDENFRDVCGALGI